MGGGYLKGRKDWEHLAYRNEAAVLNRGNTTNKNTGYLRLEASSNMEPERHYDGCLEYSGCLRCAPLDHILIHFGSSLLPFTRIPFFPLLRLDFGCIAHQHFQPTASLCSVMAG